MMNQGKIGAFISERRKAKGWTQSQLAEKLGITDKAVSKWETGRSMPDLSLFMPLCTLLEITLNELFAGECISEQNLKEKADEVLMSVIASWLGQEKQVSTAQSAVAKTVLDVQNVSKRYQTKANAVLAVNNVSFQIPHGSFVGIMGASGSGKTTLLNIIATIDKPTSGKISIGGQSIVDMPENEAADFRRGHLGFVFQEYNLLDTLTLYENIALAMTIKNVPAKHVAQTILEISEALGITAILDKFPHEVSGGQRQRCACARALVVNPELILADEPTGALDSHAARQLLGTFSMMCRDYHATILMVTHDVVAASHCDRILFMRDGELKATLNRDAKSKQTFFADILKKMEWIEGESYDVLETVNP
ncbi:MAG: ATP-binding cassette domain-containing protein [Lachnospiraceae bacterium]|nr:ATP-binding cassette domain-containing protein [Lachnospiraceae bacterium]